MEQKAIVLYLHAHQPYRIKSYSIFDIGEDHNYFDGQGDGNNKRILKKVAENLTSQPIRSYLRC